MGNLTVSTIFAIEMVFGAPPDPSHKMLIDEQGKPAWTEVVSDEAARVQRQES